MSAPARRLTLDLLRPHAPALALAAGLAAVIAACQGGLVWLVRDVLDAMLVAGDPAARTWLPLAIVLLFTVQGTARFLRTLLTRRAALQAEASLRERAYAALLRLPNHELQRLGRGEATSRLIHDCGKVRTAVGAAVTALQRPLTGLAVGVSAALLSPKLAGLAALGLPLVAAVVWATGHVTRTTARTHLESLGRLQARLRDGLEGLRTIQAYGAEAQAAEAVGAAERDQVEVALKSHAAKVAGPPVVEWVAALAFAVVLAIGAGDVQAGRLTPGALLAFLVALGLLNEPLKGIAQAWGLWQDAQAGLGRTAELLVATPASVADGDDLPAGPVTVELRGASVDRGRGPVFSGLDLSLAPGDLVVIQGESGAGKSTLLDLIGGFVEPFAGQVEWNGRSAGAWSLRSRRRATAWVDQQPWLGVGSLADAVRLGRPDADDAAVDAAVRAAGLDPSSGLLHRLAAGAATAVGDGGEPLSGGEQQRIALARALVRRAPLLLLDEPTSHLDGPTEAALLDTLSSLRPGRILVVVTHRDAPLRHATRAYRLSAGGLRRLDLAEAAS